ncbi:winged helix-turn-helix domain-containing protein [Halobium salinum]|uniref:Winged helix-turn-helix domain-containing protein n=1 Tax=Halobium salinum TaxID=1364940 RepID=A0ABD5P9R8_9EURY|nr:winged helix-turn-helix domain-containing protein [Halobium salinum]
MSSDTLTPDAAFALLGDETRIAILRALFENPYEPLSFSELRERVGTRDSGRFNYHLGKLVGQFVRKTDDGYELTLAGWAVLGGVLSGTYTDSGYTEPVPYEEPCPACGGHVLATYADERMRVVCTDCDEQFSSAGVPPGALEGYDRDELPLAFERYMNSLVAQARNGVCISCAGRLEPTLRLDLHDLPVDDDEAPLVVYECHRCPELVTVSVGNALLDHPVVVAFHHERGVDLRRVPSWTLGWTRREPVVESDDPVRVRVAVDVNGDSDTLELVVDEHLRVVETVAVGA